MSTLIKTNLFLERKRSIKDRLGPIQPFQEPALDNLSIPPPGIPRIIPELSASLIEKGSINEIAEELAAKLCEPKTELITGVLEIIGIPHSLKLFKETQDIEKNGGKMIKNGSRRRTPGGLFLQLLRESKEAEINQKAIKQLFNVSSRIPPVQKVKKNFQVELKEFRKLSEDFRNIIKSEESPEEFCDRVPEPFVEPEAPPNSVERPLLAHDEEDELHCDSLDIELS
ncbi:PHAX [Lepeophtheirus salmonis]|uniref:Phosphorylated adapter RNA export protein n=1 Tax=Lepeophtheirus salmonis TaxID=72036 RepID=A0A7R8CJQ2_LEPSM|nr:PHAX [Lepeophtheirus salmonis]CAF2808127.1 PHAX [Lepeophtheirus salmonis]